MNEDDWEAAYDPLEMLEALEEVAETRPFWHYIICCLRGIGETQTAELIEGRLQGIEDENALRQMRTLLQGQSNRTSGGGYSLGRKPVSIPPSTQRARAGLAALECSAILASMRVTQETRHLLQREQCEWLRCLFCNPFRPVALDPSWLTSTVRALASGIDGDRAYDRLPFLADALQDAGCENPDILNHCRGPGPHSRGCWVVAAVLDMPIERKSNILIVDQ